jgi:hypothetical protein
MSVPIIYYTTVPDIGQTGSGDGMVALINDDVTAANSCVLATVGGILSLTLTSRGSALTSGTYNNITVHSNQNPTRSLGILNLGVSATGQLTVVGIQGPGYGFQLNDTINVAGVVGTASSVLTTITVNTVLPCSPPFPIGTKYIEIECDANGPAFVTFDTTLTSLGITNGVLTTLQSTLTTVASRINSNERIIRRMTAPPALIIGEPPQAAQYVPISLQLIIGTAAA